MSSQLSAKTRSSQLTAHSAQPCACCNKRTSRFSAAGLRGAALQCFSPWHRIDAPGIGFRTKLCIKSLSGTRANDKQRCRLFELCDGGADHRTRTVPESTLKGEGEWRVKKQKPRRNQPRRRSSLCHEIPRINSGQEEIRHVEGG